MISVIKILLALNFSVLLIGQQVTAQPKYIHIKNVRIWDGKIEKLQDKEELLIIDDLIAEIGPDIKTPKGAVIIDGRGGTLIPGLSDAHVHLAFTHNSSNLRNKINSRYATIVSAKSAEHLLLQGFTTVRDMGGPVFGLKQAIDEGLVAGPRIFPSGAFIGQTSGHSDMRNANEPHPYWHGHVMNPMELEGWNFIADGKVEVLKASRENLKKGASQLKVMAGGGISSEFDPLHSVQYTAEEMKASVEAAKDWNTYVAVHAYTAESIQRALNAGVMCIEHGQLIDEPTMKLLKAKGAWLVPQTFWSLTPDEEINSRPPHIAKKTRMVYTGIDTELELAKKLKANIAFGSDMAGGIPFDDAPLREISSRTRWFSPFEVLKQATSENARLFNLSGALHPYRDGKLGVIEKGAYADLLIYDENPLKDIEVIVNFESHLKVIIKDGEVIKNGL